MDRGRIDCHEDCGVNQTAPRIVQEPIRTVKRKDKGFLRIISFNSIAYGIINPLLQEIKNHPKVVFSASVAFCSDLLLFGCLNGNQDGDIIANIGGIFTHIELGALYLSLSIGAAIVNS